MTVRGARAVHKLVDNLWVNIIFDYASPVSSSAAFEYKDVLCRSLHPPG